MTPDPTEKKKTEKKKERKKERNERSMIAEHQAVVVDGLR